MLHNLNLSHNIYKDAKRGTYTFVLNTMIRRINVKK